MHTNPSASCVFEELIHNQQQVKNGFKEISSREKILYEIEAKEKLLHHIKSYGITEYEEKLTRDSLFFYKKKLEEIE